MPRTVKPTSPARRRLSYDDFDNLARVRPVKRLTKKIARTGGRDASGKISIRHRGGGAKRLYRLIDFKLNLQASKATVIRLEYDPYRSAHIALIEYEHITDKIKRRAYILAPDNVKPDDEISINQKTAKNSGSRLKLADIPIGQPIHNIELLPNQGGKLVRSAGNSAVITAKEGKYANLKLPSGEIRKILLECSASIGRVSNPGHNLVRIAKAGRNRWLGRRPTVRGKAMHPAAHPHGGGEGVNPIGMKHPKTPWGKPALGVKTRRNHKMDKFIISRRKKGSR